MIFLALALWGCLGSSYRGRRLDYIPAVRLRGEVDCCQANEGDQDHVANKEPRGASRVPEQQGGDGRRKPAREYPRELVDGPDPRITDAGVEEFGPPRRQGTYIAG